MFLTPRAVCLVVCDAGAFGQQGGGEVGQIEEDIRNLDSLRVCDWLRSISYRVPESEVILVATKCDLAGGNVAGIAQRMDAACRMWLDRWSGDGMAPVRVEDGVCQTSCLEAACLTHTVFHSNRRHAIATPSVQPHPTSCIHSLRYASNISAREVTLGGNKDDLAFRNAVRNGSQPITNA